jgi:DNA-directed RNA polymerase subunit RPC12/RpoP
MTKQTLAQEYRSLARTQLDNAEVLLRGSDDDLLFVCLKLRQCIESLSYGLLVTYRHELSTAAMMSWTPRKALDELESADPLANTSRTISIEIPSADGASEPIVLSGEDRRFSPKWANKAYNKLSSILHVPTPKTLEANAALSAEKIRSQCREYVELLETVFTTDIWHFMSGQFVDHTCDCGFLIKRRVESVNKNTIFECSECGRCYDVTSFDEREVGISLRVAKWICYVCSSENELGAHELAEGKEIECRHCGTLVKISKTWTFS